MQNSYPSGVAIAQGFPYVKAWVYSAGTCVGCSLVVILTVLSPKPAATYMLFCFLGLMFLNYMLGGRDVLYPAFIFCASWSTATLVYLFCPVEIDELAWKTVHIFIGGGACFTIGSLIGRRPFAHGKPWFVNAPRNPQGARLTLAYSLAILPLFVLDTARLAGQSALSPEFLMAARATLVSAESPPYSSRLLGIAPLVAVVSAWFLLLERDRKTLTVIGSFVAAFMCLLGGGRGTLLQFLCGCYVLILIRQPKRTVRRLGGKLAVAGVVLVVSMTLLALILKQETQGSDGPQIAINMSATYIAGPLSAFNYQVTHPRLFEDQPWNTATQLLTPLVRKGVVPIKLPPTHEQFINIPFPFNVFTIYKPYYHDGGILGCMLALLLLGVAYGGLFQAAVRGNKLALFFLAALMDALIMSVFHDNFNYQLTIYTYLVAFALFYFFVLNRLPRIGLHMPCCPQAQKSSSTLQEEQV